MLKSIGDYTLALLINLH